MRYWAFMNGEVPGSYGAEELAALPGFSMTTLVCPAQGEIAEKNWRRAGEFSDIARAVAAREQAVPPPAPAAAVAAEAAAMPADAGVDALIDTASTKLFSHVADLMKELENRREEKALILSLQRQIVALKEDLGRTRERADMLETRLTRFAEFEETSRKDRAALDSMETAYHSREQELNDMRISTEKYKNDAEAAKRRHQESVNDLVIRNRLVDKLSKELGEKELSLAKSLGVIRRLEEDLNRLCPDPALIAGTPEKAAVSAPPLAAPSGADPAAKPAAATPPAEPVVYTLDEPPATPPYLEPPVPNDRPKAQQALGKFFKKIFPDQPH